MDLEFCIQRCTDCHATCLGAIAYCLDKGGTFAQADDLALLQTCADICRISADAMLRGADVHTVLCGACSEICDRCATACEDMEDDAEMKACAQICRECAESCASMMEEA